MIRRILARLLAKPARGDHGKVVCVHMMAGRPSATLYEDGTIIGEPGFRFERLDGGEFVNSDDAKSHASDVKNEANDAV